MRCALFLKLAGRRSRRTTRRASTSSSCRRASTRPAATPSTRVLKLLNVAFQTHPFAHRARGRAAALDRERRVRADHRRRVPAPRRRRQAPAARGLRRRRGALSRARRAAPWTRSGRGEAVERHRLRRLPRAAAAAVLRRERSRRNEGAAGRRRRARARHRLVARAASSRARDRSPPRAIPGLAKLGRCVPVAASDVAALARRSRDRERPDLTIVGPEAPLAAGIVDAFRDGQLPVFGPTRAAARIEASKAFAKQLMLRRRRARPRAPSRHTTLDGALHAIRQLGAPVVIKASGLAAGKGVIVCETHRRRRPRRGRMLTDKAFGDAGARSSSRSSWRGRSSRSSCSPMACTRSPCSRRRITSGCSTATAARTPAAWARTRRSPSAPTALVDEAMERDHRAHARGAARCAARRSRDSCTPASCSPSAARGWWSSTRASAIRRRRRCSRCSTSDLLEPLLAIARGETLVGRRSSGSDAHAVTTVVAAAGYPDSPRDRRAHHAPAAARRGVTIFHAGTAADADGALRDRRRPRLRRHRAPRTRSRPRSARARTPPARSSSTAGSSATTSAGGSCGAMPELPETETIARGLERRRQPARASPASPCRARTCCAAARRAHCAARSPAPHRARVRAARRSW